MTMVLCVVVGVLAGLETHFEPGHDGQQIPFQLEQSIPLTRAQRTESHHWVFHFATCLVEFGVDETVVFERLPKKIILIKLYNKIQIGLLVVTRTAQHIFIVNYF